MSGGFGSGNQQLDEFKEVVDMFNNINDRCFMDCVYNFRTRKLASDEKKCIVSCSEKWISSTQRITRAFVKHQWQEAQDAQEAQNKKV